MSILPRLEKNKGTLSSALGKQLAAEVLGGDMAILREAVELSVLEPDDPARRGVRAGAAKIVEIVAERRPDLVVPYLPRLLPALSVPEPQTRWMIIRTMGFCAHLDPATARKAVPHAGRYIAEKEGLCIASSADLFLGDLGSLGAGDARRVYPLLRASAATAVRNEEDWLLEAFGKLYPRLGERERAGVEAFARKHERAARKSTRERVSRLLALRG